MFKLKKIINFFIKKSKIFITTLSIENKIINISNKDLYSFLLGLFVFIIAILFLELFNQSFYFTQDDGFHALFPTMLYGCKSFFEHGMLAEINPFQFCCVPLAAVGTSALLYPITYISYLIAKYICLTEYAMMDVFVITHLLIAYISSFFAARSCGVRKYLSVIFALSYAFSGYSLIVGRSWPTISPTIAYSPFIILSVNSVIKNKQNFFWALWTGTILGVLFLAGHIQMWVYTMIFFVFTFFVIFCCKKISFKQLLGIIYPIIICLIIIMPQLYVELDLFKGLERGIQSHNWPELKDCLLSCFLPLHFFNDLLISGVTIETFKTIVFSGGIFHIIYLFCLLNLFLQKGKVALSFLKNNPYFILGFIAFLFSLGDNIGLFPIIHKLLFLNSFKWAHKLIVFMNLFLNLSAVILLSKLLISNSKKFKYICICFMILLLFVHLYSARDAFFKYNIKPYPKISNIVEKIDNIYKYRIFSYSPERSINPIAVLTMKLNFPTIYALNCYGGYIDMLSSSLKNNFIGKTFCYRNYSINIYDIKDFGVKYIFFQKPYICDYYLDNLYSDNIIENKYIESFDKYFNPVYEDESIKIYDIGNCRPLAFIADTGQELPIEFNACGAIVDTSNIEEDTWIVANMMYYPNYRVFTGDGREVKKLNDNFNRIVTFSPKGNDKLIIKYESPWYIGSLISLWLIILICGIYLLQFNRSKRKNNLKLINK